MKVRELVRPAANAVPSARLAANSLPARPAVHGCENEAEAEIALQSVEGRMDVILWQVRLAVATPNLTQGSGPARCVPSCKPPIHGP